MGHSTGWNVDQFVKDSQPPYRLTEKQSIQGWTKLSSAPEPNKPVSFRVMIPYNPVPVSEFALFAAETSSIQ
jgi:hypothetical protein